MRGLGRVIACLSQDRDDLVLDCVKLVHEVADAFGRVDEGLLVPRAGQKPGHCVVILSGDRIELVIVATGAGEREAQERLREDVELIVDPAHLLFADIDG